MAICARTASTLEEAAAHIHKTTGRKVFHKAMDVTDSTAVAAFDAAVEARFGRVGICVTNSGGPPSNVFKNTSRKIGAPPYQLLMNTIFFANETLPRMQKNKWGRLITITSSAVIAVDGGLVRSLL